MNRKFNIAVGHLLAHEGGFNDDPNDNGGATNFGISLRSLKTIKDEDGDGFLDGDLDRDGDVDIVDIQNLSIQDAKNIYRSQWFERYGYRELENQELINGLLALSVHAGPGRAHRILQTAISTHFPIKIDGLIGRKTLAAANHKKLQEGDRLVVEFKHETASFYRRIVERDRTQIKFLNGWINRAYY